MARPQYDELPSSPRDCDVILFAFDPTSRPQDLERAEYRSVPHPIERDAVSPPAARATGLPAVKKGMSLSIEGKLQHA